MCYLFYEISDGPRAAISRFIMPTLNGEIIMLGNKWLNVLKCVKN